MATHKDVDPRGFLLNDNDTGVDHLGKCTFADAIAESVHLVDTPITIGLYAKWGSGKSFLLRQLESILKRYEKQSLVDEKEKERFPEGTRIKCSIVRSAFSWIFCTLSLLAVIFVTFILALDAAFLLNILGIDNDITTPTNFNNSSTMHSTTSVDGATTQIPPLLSTLKIIGLILIPIEILTILLIGCCGNKWLSSKYYGSFRILTYATFTKLPVRNVYDDIIEDPGQHPTQVLKHIRPGDERLAIAASKTEIFTRRYIFVDFKAWEYAGSDTLWAGIVTNIMDAIEAEFGVITARMFRMLTVEEIPKKILDCGNRTLHIELAPESERDEVLDMMKQYGVVIECEQKKNSQWRVVYSSDGEFRNAKECLLIEGVNFQEGDYLTTNNPKRKPKPSYYRGQSGRESKRKLLRKKDDVEMTTLSNGRVTEEDGDALNRLTLPPETACCNRFCAHFLKYPTKLLCLPRLVWWILIAVCSILIPAISYIIAKHLDLDLYRTYRAVPVFGQVLLWLPAGLTISTFVCSFIWAMCHSQRKRINEALDGAKTKMANELGFMNKVKTEIQVITKLIQCARFTHQKDYKVVITIDDLDRVPLKKVQSVLEAVSILLSDKAAPFICFVAVDPRIVVKCIEEGMGEIVRQAKITGHEYLKKIITLPICLPEIGDSDKKRFIAGLIDQADHTITYREEEERSKKHKNDHKSRNTTSVDGGGDQASRKQVAFQDRTEDEIDASREGILKVKNLSCPTQPSNSVQESSCTAERRKIIVQLDHKSFLFNCRKFLYYDNGLHQHLQGNPRNIKRLFNVISLTACIINCFIKKERRRRFIQAHTPSNQDEFMQDNEKLERTEEFAEDLVRWIVLADQWPYRTSYILQVIEDADQRGDAEMEDEKIPDEWTIFEIFLNKVSSEYEIGDTSLLCLDGDPDIFYSYILLLKKCNFTKQRIKRLEKFTVNLDYSIRHTIAFQRDLSCFNPIPVEEEKEIVLQVEREVICPEPQEPRETIVDENSINVAETSNQRRNYLPILIHC